MPVNLFPKRRKIYVIYTPPWTHASSGVRALHLLCHALNQMGEKAYLIFTIQISNVLYRNPFLQTPPLGELLNEVGSLNNSEFDYVAIYPDIIPGNPFNAKHVVRWHLGTPEMTGRATEFPEGELIYGYTKDISEKVLCIPTVDLNVFYDRQLQRRGDCFYSYKYDRIHGRILLPITYGMKRCEGAPDDIAKILSSSVNCYVYERSEIIQTARLCGCNVIPLVTDYWHGQIPEEFVDTSQEEIVSNFEVQLNRFICETQAMK